MNKIVFADLFAGIGGFHQAFLNICSADKIEYECKLVSEIDKWAKEVYSTNYNFSKNLIFDINDFDSHISNTKIDLVFCGFPCQPFSNAGFRKGFEDLERGNLIFKVKEFVEKTKPKIILLENVRHIVKHNNNQTFEKILKIFVDLDYIGIDQKNPLILSPIDFGLKQNRKRVFIPLVKKTLFKKVEKSNNSLLPSISIDEFRKNFIIDNFTFEKSVDKKYYINSDLKNVLDAWEEFVAYFQKIKRTIPVVYLDEMLDRKKIDKEKYYKYFWYKQYVDKMTRFYNENKTFINMWAKKHKVKNWRLIRNKKMEWQAGETKFTDAYLQLRQSGLRFKRNNCFPTLVATVQTPVIHSKQGWRYLTPREVAQLQNFPKDLSLCKMEHEAYKQFGNSVNVKVVEYVIRSYLLKYVEFLNEKN